MISEVYWIPIVHDLQFDESHVRPSYSPSPDTAHEGWTYQFLSLSLVSPNFSWISWGFIAKIESRQWNTFTRSACGSPWSILGVFNLYSNPKRFRDERMEFRLQFSFSCGPYIRNRANAHHKENFDDIVKTTKHTPQLNLIFVVTRATTSLWRTSIKPQSTGKP